MKLKLFHWLFCDWGPWQDIILNVMKMHPFTQQIMGGKQDAQTRICKICNKKQVRDVS